MELALTFIQDLATVLVLAFLVSATFSRLGQPVILGYLVSGAIVGPYALKIVYNIDIVNLFAELGVILLMFYIGLEFNLKKLKKVGSVAVIGGVFGMAFMLGIGHALGRLLGWSSIDSIFLGGILTISSTAIISKILADMGHLRKTHAQIIMGVLIIEDIGAVALLTILGSIAMLSSVDIAGVVAVIFRVFLFFVIALTLGLGVIPKSLDWLSGRTSSREVLMLAALGLCFAFATFSNLLGFSVALGAFMMGAIISECRCREEIENVIAPIKDMFATMFFISIGMLVDVFTLKSLLGVIILVSAVTVIGKIASRGVVTYLLGYRGSTALSVGMGLIQIGEFSFVIAKQGVDSGAVSPFMYQLTVAVSILTTLLTPYSIKHTAEIAQRIDRYAPVQMKNFFGYLASWTTLITREIKSRNEARIFKRKAVDVAVNVLIIIMVWLFVFGVANYLRLRAEVFSFVLAGVLSLPSVYIILSRIHSLIHVSLEILGRKYELFGNSVVRTTVHNVVYLAVTLFIAVNLLPLLAARVPGHTFIVLVPVLLIGYMFWRTINRFQEGLDKMIRDTILVAPVSDETARRSEVINIIAKGIKESKIVDQLEITQDSPALGKSIGETRLRTLTGATIISIDRGGAVISNPSHTERFQHGDLVVIIGSVDERKKAAKALVGK